MSIIVVKIIFSALETCDPIETYKMCQQKKSHRVLELYIPMFSVRMILKEIKLFFDTTLEMFSKLKQKIQIKNKHVFTKSVKNKTCDINEETFRYKYIVWSYGVKNLEALFSSMYCFNR